MTKEEKQSAFDTHEGNVFAIEDQLEALTREKQQDSQQVQIKVVSIDPPVIRIGITADPEWKYTV